MIKLKQFTEEYLDKYRGAFAWVLENLDVVDGKYYIYDEEEHEKLLYRFKNEFVIFEVNPDESLNIEMFNVDSEYKLNMVGTEDYEVNLSLDFPIFIENETGLENTIQITKRKDGLDVDGYNALISYIQYNPMNDTRSIISYQYNSRQLDRIYDYHLNNPFQISIETEVTKRDKGNKLVGHYNRYIVRKTNTDDLYYDIMLIKEYGLSKFLSEGQYKLSKGQELSKYYKILGSTPNNYAITMFPFCRQYNLEELYGKLESIGHKIKVDPFIVQFFNGDYEDLNSYIEIATKMMEIEKEPIDPVTLTLGMEY